MTESKCICDGCNKPVVPETEYCQEHNNEIVLMFFPWLADEH